MAAYQKFDLLEEAMGKSKRALVQLVETRFSECLPINQLSQLQGWLQSGAIDVALQIKETGF